MSHELLRLPGAAGARGVAFLGQGHRGLVGAFLQVEEGRAAGQLLGLSVTCHRRVTAGQRPPTSARAHIYHHPAPPRAVCSAHCSALRIVQPEPGSGDRGAREAWGEGERRAAPRWGSTGAPGRRRRTCASWRTSRSTATPTGARCPSKQVAAATSWALQNECAWRVAGGRGENALIDSP